MMYQAIKEARVAMAEKMDSATELDGECCDGWGCGGNALAIKVRIY